MKKIKKAYLIWLFYDERVTGIEPASRPWQGRIIATIRYPQ